MKDSSNLPTPPVWRYDERHSTLDLRFRYDGHEIWVWISPRPLYCDRGHWQFGVMQAGRMHLDGQDSFPRYFMSLGAAIEEAERWLRWRLAQQTETPYFPALLATAHGRTFVP